MIGLPTPSPLTEPFWSGAADRQLVRQVCDDCGTNLFTPRIACPACQSEALTWQRSDGLGTVYSTPSSTARRPATVTSPTSWRSSTSTRAGT